MFHRQYMHRMLQEFACQEEGEGTPVKLLVDHAVREVDTATGELKFANGVTAHHDLVIGADGIGSVVRKTIGLHPDRRPSDQSCLHCNVMTKDAVNAGLVDYSVENALEYWGGKDGDRKWDKILLSRCNGGRLLSYYCFFPRQQ